MATVEGIPQLLAKFKNFQAKGERLAKAIVQSTADEIVADAKQRAPADLGRIRQEIGKEIINDGYGANIVSGAPESPYQEFGTGPRVSVPAEMSEIAATFKGGNGQNGNFADFVKALTDWVLRKGFVHTYSVTTRRRSRTTDATREKAKSAAYVIAVSILKKGLKPQPFLYPAWLAHAHKLPERLQRALTRLANEES